tara:strand:- start:2445 stop:2621 length:177 start_codon:yes stop_codon:yes gene_type:complete
MEPYKEQDYKGMFNLLVMEKHTIKHYLDKKEMSKKKISFILGISEPTLKVRIAKHNLS